MLLLWELRTQGVQWAEGVIIEGVQYSAAATSLASDSDRDKEEERRGNGEDAGEAVNCLSLDLCNFMSIGGSTAG